MGPTEQFFAVRGGAFERVAHLRPFRLPGGEAAIREGWRVAAALAPEWQMHPQAAFVRRMAERDVNSPWTTSVGRLFDAVAALAGLAFQSRFEGQAAMLLERAVAPGETKRYSLPGGDWRPLIESVQRDTAAGTDRGLIAARFHNALVDWVVETAIQGGIGQVVLSGGVFQNRYLLERSAAGLEARGFRVYSHQRVPPNDGGIALGQAVLAGR
jgi:hydrogenase maturation protein HypF